MDTKVLEDITAIREIDKSDMLDLLINFPNQCEDALCIADDLVIPEDYKIFENIVFGGLGGSAIGADIMRAYLSKISPVPIIVNRDYLIPDFVNEKTLFFISSYSGNTEETLSMYEAAKAGNAKIILLTSGGKLRELAQNDNIPYITVPEGFPPRTALGYMFFPLLSVLSRLKVVEEIDEEIEETIDLLKTARDEELAPEVTIGDNCAKQIAQELCGKFPVIYGSCNYFEGVVTRWRAQFAENAKHLSSSHLLPEMNHNEIVGWQYPEELFKDFIVLFLRDAEDHKRVQKRFEIAKEIIESIKVQTIEIWSKGDRLLARLFYLIYVGDFTSFYLALLNDIDPTPVKRIDFLKAELGKE